MIINAPFDSTSPKCYRTKDAPLPTGDGVLEIGYNRVPRGLRQIMKRNAYILHYVTDGRGTLLGEPFEKGDGYLIAPGELEIIEADGANPYESFWIMFESDSAEAILESCSLPRHNGTFKFRDTERCAKILKRALFELQPKTALEEALLMQSAFYELLALHARRSEKDGEPSSDLAKSAMKFINESYQRDLKIDDLATQLGFTRNYLYMLFKKEYGVSPKEYLISLRIEKAKELLLDETKRLSVGEVAFAVGFGDPLYFSRVFRERTGCSPSAYKSECGVHPQQNEKRRKI